MNDRRLGFIGIIIENGQNSVEQVNRTLSEHSTIIIGRTGIPYREKDCKVITLIVDATTDELGALTGKLGSIPGVSSRSALSKGK